VVEDVVQREYERLSRDLHDFCGCDICKEDVMVYALNRLPPRYVSQAVGDVVSRIAFDTDQRRADVSIALLEAFRRVQSNPRAGHAPRKEA